MALQVIKVPDIGDFDTVEIIEILINEGDHIKEEDSLITVESDKASMEIPSPVSGLVKEIKVELGAEISEGSVILLLEASTEKPVEVIKPVKEKIVVTKPTIQTESKPKTIFSQPSPTQAIDEVTFTKAYASPAIRKFARELGVDLGKVTGKGRKRRILKADVKDFVKASLQQKTVSATRSSGLTLSRMPVIDFTQWGETETIKLSKINQLTGEILHRNWVSLPHVTQFDEADITEMEAFRKKMGEELSVQNIKITPVAFIMKAVVATLKTLPRFNASLDETGKNLIQKKYYHIGVAVDTPNGLVVPVIRDADKKSLIELSQEIRTVAIKARNKKLKPSDMQGGCFTISSLGGIGGTKFTPIINAPEVAILGVSRSKIQAIWNGEQFEPKLMLPLCLSYDHRVIDGADGARFTTHLSHTLSDIRRLLL